MCLCVITDLCVSINSMTAPNKRRLIHYIFNAIKKSTIINHHTLIAMLFTFVQYKWSAVKSHFLAGDALYFNIAFCNITKINI